MSGEFERKVLEELGDIKKVVRELHTLNKNIERLIEKLGTTNRDPTGK